MKQTLFILLAATLVSGCATSKKAEEVEEDPTAILDEPIPERHRVKRKAKSDPKDPGPMMLLPATPEDPAIEVDAKDDDWKGKKFRKFDRKSSIQDGSQYWQGRKDASMRVSVDADQGFIYAYIEVEDDKVIETPMGEDPTDGVVLWLRDPGLDALGKALPPSVGLHQYVDAETAILILPSGRVETFKGEDNLDFNKVLRHDVAKDGGGYTIELALRLEALEEISEIPLTELAFRVELLDGDEEDRPGYQTLMSTTPDRGDDAPRLATFELDGLLPAYDVGAPPPRTNSIGRWKVEGDRWKFASFEVVPKYWATVEDREGFEKTLLDSEALGGICGQSTNDIRLIDAYESKKGGIRAGLVMCGDRAPRGKCPSDARTHIKLVELKADGDDWRLENEIEVFEKPSKQCPSAEVPGEVYYSHLSLFPVDVLSSSVWAVGWTRERNERYEVEQAYGMTLLNTQYKVPYLGTTTTRFRRMNTEERTLSDSSVYLTYVDDDDNVDICQIENLVEQACDGLDRGCVTYEHGKTRLTQIQMWSKKKRRFERYELSKHPGCKASFDFSSASGYLVLQLKDRIGLLPSPKTNESDDESLELF